MTDEFDIRMRSLYAERMRPMARWQLEPAHRAQPLTSAEEEAELLDVPADIHAAAHRRVLTELDDTEALWEHRYPDGKMRPTA